MDILTETGKWMCHVELLFSLKACGHDFPMNGSVEEALDTLYHNTPVCRRYCRQLGWEYQMLSLE